MSIAKGLRGALERAVESPWLDRLLQPNFPSFTVEVSASGLRGVSVSRARGVGRVAHRIAVELPDGVVKPSLLKPAVKDTQLFRNGLEEVVREFKMAVPTASGYSGPGASAIEAPTFEGQLSLVIPDHVAKISFVDLVRR